MTKLSMMAPGLRERGEELVPLVGLLVLQFAWKYKKNGALIRVLPAILKSKNDLIPWEP